MFNLNINWQKIIKENLPFFLHTNRRLDWIKALMSPFNQIYQEFLQAYNVFLLKIGFTWQVIYMEKLLNDKFSPVYGGIQIVDGSTIPINYIYRNSESKPPVYLYRRWKSTVSYSINHFSVFGNKVYKCLIANSNKQPYISPTYWQYQSEVMFLRRKTEFYMQYDFIVRVPASLTFNVVSMKAIIDYYRFAGKRYKIEIY